MITNAKIYALLTLLSEKVDILMSQQDDINADVTSIEASIAALQNAATAIQQEIAQLQSANPALDLSALNTQVANLTQAAAAISAIPPAPPAPAS